MEDREHHLAIACCGAHLEEFVDVDGATAVEVHEVHEVPHIFQSLVRGQVFVEQCAALLELLVRDQLSAEQKKRPFNNKK